MLSSQELIHVPGTALVSKAKQWLRHAAHPKRYFLASLIISLGGFLNGYDTGSIGSITEMQTFQRTVAALSPTMRGFTVSFLLLAGSFPSPFAGLLADKSGHLKIVLAGAPFFTVGAALEAAAMNLIMLLVGRGLVGIGEGLYLGNMNVYICEIAPRTQRGMLVALPQTLVTLGTCAGYFTCYGTVRMSGDMEWRLPFIVQAARGALMALACYLLPESPRWLMAHSRTPTALRNMKSLDLAADEIQYGSSSDAELRAESLPEAPFSWDNVTDIFRKKYRFRTLLALFILGMVQLCGIDGVLYYAPTLSAQAGLPADTASFIASGVSAILMFAISIPAFILADHWGRRTIVVFGGLILTICMAIIGSIYASNTGASLWAIIIPIFAFALTYVFTWGMIGKIYASEIQPAHNRVTANALAQSLNFFTNFLVAFITLIFLARSSSGPYFLFAGLTLITLSILWIYMPETRGRSLESIQDTFHPPMESIINRAWSDGGHLGGLRRRDPAINFELDERI